MTEKLLIAIDPGTEVSAAVYWAGGAIGWAQILKNDDCLDSIRKLTSEFEVAVEMIASYGMAVGKEVFETCLVIGRIQEICAARNIPCRLVYRRDVKLHHCGSARAKDANIRQALIDKYGAPGTKKQKGGTYGIKSHMWSALAIATFVAETSKTEIKECA